MTVDTTLTVVNGKQTIRALRKIDPQLKADFRAKVKEIAAPAIAAAAGQYTQVPLSNMGYKWTVRGRDLFPFNVAKARAGVRVNIDTRHRTKSLITIEQRDVAASVFETAGRKTRSRLSQSLDLWSANRGWRIIQPGRTRLIGPAVYRARPDIEKQMEQVLIAAANKVQRELG